MFELILLLNPVYVTLFWAIVLNFYSPVKHLPKTFLGKFMAVAFVVYLSHFIYFSGLIDLYRIIDSAYIWASLLVYPLYHIYIRLLTVEKNFSFKFHSWFLILPSVVFLMYLFAVLIMDKQEYHEFFGEVLPGLKKASGIHYYSLFVYYIWRVVFVIQVVYYLYFNFVIIRKNNRQLNEFYSNIESRSLNWVQFFNISLAVTSIASIIAAIAGRERFADNSYMLLAPSIVFSAMLFLIGLIGNTQNEAHTISIESDNDKAPTPPEDLNIKMLKNKLDNLFTKQKIYTNPDLKIWDVSKMLGSNRTYVSKLINDHYHRNFRNHVNHYRVEHAKELAKTNPELNNHEIAELSGFGSLHSLYRAFMALEGVSLNQFRKQPVNY